MSSGLTIRVAGPGYASGYDQDRHRWRASYAIPESRRRVDLLFADNLLDETDQVSWIVTDLEGERYAPIGGGFSVAERDELVRDILHDENDPRAERGAGPTRPANPGLRRSTLQVPALGRFHVEVTIHGRRGTRQLSGDAAVEDWLVVCLGDSFLAGQGNPDRAGNPASFVPVKQTSIIVSQFEGADEYARVKGDPPQWLERLAWRSLNNAATRACREISDQWRQMRLLHVASSGATTLEGLIGPQRAFQSLGQIDEAKEALGDRRPDLVLISIGANDVGFSTSLRQMATGLDSVLNLSTLGEALLTHGVSLVSAYKRTFDGDLDEVSQAFGDALAKLRANLDSVSDKLTDALKPRAVIVSEYPEGLFNDANGAPADGCGVFDSRIVAGASITQTEAAFIAESGAKLNQVLRDWCDDHGYYFAEGIAADFAAHGYCTSDTYLIGAEESVRRQLDLEGTMHPNATGHGVIADHLVGTMESALADLGDPAYTFAMQSQTPEGRVRDHRTGPSPATSRQPAGPAGRQSSGPRPTHRVRARPADNREQD